MELLHGDSKNNQNQEELSIVYCHQIFTLGSNVNIQNDWSASIMAP